MLDYRFLAGVHSAAAKTLFWGISNNRHELGGLPSEAVTDQSGVFSQCMRTG